MAAQPSSRTNREHAADSRLASAAESSACRLAAPVASRTTIGQKLACLCCNQSLRGLTLSCAAGCGGEVHVGRLPHSGWSSVGAGYVCPVCVEALPSVAFQVASAKLAQSNPLFESIGDVVESSPPPPIEGRSQVSFFSSLRRKLNSQQVEQPRRCSALRGPRRLSLTIGLPSVKV